MKSMGKKEQASIPPLPNSYQALTNSLQPRFCQFVVDLKSATVTPLLYRVCCRNGRRLDLAYSISDSDQKRSILKRRRNAKIAEEGRERNCTVIYASTRVRPQQIGTRPTRAHARKSGRRTDCACNLSRERERERRVT